MQYDQAKKQLSIVENVVIRHGGVVIQCDSAVRRTEEGIIEGFGSIYIYQQDTFTLSGGEYLRYTEESRTAMVTGKNVLLRDQQMTLQSTALYYNTLQQMGYYTSGAEIVSEGNRLQSRRGYYHRRGNVFYFKDNVQLRSPEYTMYSDTLDYHAGSKTAYFFGPTRIISKENRIECNYGWYNTRSEKAQFSKRAGLYSDSVSILADSLLYDRKTGTGTGIGNIHLCDSVQKADIYGQYGQHFEKTSGSMISGNPLAVIASGKDTMYLSADTFYFRNDSVRLLKAFRNTRILQSELQGRCDSMVYHFSDSVIRLFHKPILWNGLNQITGDTMRVFTANNTVSALQVSGNAFIASEVRPGHYNQIAGKTMNNGFDAGKLKTVHVEGNAASIYYLRDNETDTALYTGINKVSSASMRITLDSSKVDAIRFYGKPEGKIFPVKDFPESERYLSGFKIRSETRPEKQDLLERKKTLSPKPATPAEQTRLPQKSGRKKKKTGAA